MKLTLGTRGSALARAQSELLAARLRALGFEIEVRLVATTGDRLSHLQQPIEGKGVFTKELDEALRQHRIDFAVHSLKDLPSDTRDDLVIAAIPERADPRDALVSNGNTSLASLASGARVGTGSPRRSGQILALRPDVSCTEARGNVDTRLRRLREGAWDAVVLARAGLVRLGREAEAAQIFEVEEMIPAVGQGALAVVTRNDESQEFFRPLEHSPTRAAGLCERRLLRELEGGCRAPIAAHAFAQGAGLRLVAAVFSAEGKSFLREQARGEWSRPEELGAEVAQKLLARGAAAIVAAARGTAEGNAHG